MFLFKDIFPKKYRNNTYCDIFPVFRELFEASDNFSINAL